jgi:hypothetical protein
MTIDGNEAARALKRDLDEHGGFLTLQKRMLGERFEIGGFGKRNSEELVDTLHRHGMFVFPHPNDPEVKSLRVYDVESEIGKVALAVIDPQGVSERALIDAMKLHARAAEGKWRRAVCVPWLLALDVFFQLVIGKPPDGWEDLDDGREPYKLVEALAASLRLPADIVHEEATIRMAGAVCACRPRGSRWQGTPPALGAILAEAARKQKDIFGGVLRETAEHLLGGAEIPSFEVDLGSLGLRYRREAQGDI